MLAEPCSAFFDEVDMLRGIDEFQRDDSRGSGKGAGAKLPFPIAAEGA
jgi:hypothetical protein